TFKIMSAFSQTSEAFSTISAPAFLYSSSVKLLPKPAPDSTSTFCPAFTRSNTPVGVIATRFSLFLISFGTPIIISPYPPMCFVNIIKQSVNFFIIQNNEYQRNYLCFCTIIYTIFQAVNQDILLFFALDL